MPADLPAFIAEGRRLIAEARMGPLHAGRSDMVSYVLDDDRPFKNIYGPDAPPDDIARVWGKRCIARAQLLALAANHLPALLDLAEAGEDFARARNRVDGHDGPAYEIDADVVKTERALFAALAKLKEVG